LSRNISGHCMVMQSQQYGAVRVSNFAVEFAMEGYTTVSDANVFSYQEGGHTFYVLTFPTENVTWVYDLSTQQWHQRGWWNTQQGRYDAYRPSSHVFAFGKHLVGDRVTGVISEMSINFFTDADGAPLRRLRRAPYLVNEQQWVFVPE